MVLPGSDGSTVYVAATLVVCEPPPEPVVVGVDGTVGVPWLGGGCVAPPGTHWSVEKGGEEESAYTQPCISCLDRRENPAEGFSSPSLTVPRVDGRASRAGFTLCVPRPALSSALPPDGRGRKGSLGKDGGGRCEAVDLGVQHGTWEQVKWSSGMDTSAGVDR